MNYGSEIFHTGRKASRNPLARLKRLVQHRSSPKYKADWEGIAEYITRCRSIVTLAGCEMSEYSWLSDLTSAAVLENHSFQEVRLIFDASNFRHDPLPLYNLSKKVLFMPAGQPSPAHFFIRLLHEKDMLLRHYTENMDDLVFQAGVPEEKVVQANGSFNDWRCMRCRQEHPKLWVEGILSVGDKPQCMKCGALVRPGIVFFGEPLPKSLFQGLREVMDNCDLMIVLGSYLTTEPFSYLISTVKRDVPRLMITSEEVDDTLGLKFGTRDVFRSGDPSICCRQLCDLIGWLPELDGMEPVTGTRYFLKNTYEK